MGAFDAGCYRNTLNKSTFSHNNQDSISIKDGAETIPQMHFYLLNWNLEILTISH